MKKAIVALSGGMDSSTVFSFLLNNNITPVPVWFFYGSKHNEYEKKAVISFLKSYNFPPPIIIDLSLIFSNFNSNLLKSGGDIPEGHYTDSTMSLTVVPARNIIFLSILAGIAETRNAEYIAIGIHQGDHAIYPDCRKSFFEAMSYAIKEGTDGKVSILAPFIDTDKTGILSYGYSTNVPYEFTRTCYKDQELSCGKCGSCVERLSSFHIMGLKDPINYEDREYFKKLLAKSE